MIVRVQFFGGTITREAYDTMVGVAFYAYVGLSTMFASSNLAMVLVETISPNIYFQLAKPIAVSFLLQSSVMAVLFLIVGSFLIRNLFIYFKRNYDCQRLSFLKALTLITVSLLFINIRYGIEYVIIGEQIVLQDLDYTALGVKNITLISLLVLSDYLPLVCMIYCI